MKFILFFLLLGPNILQAINVQQFSRSNSIVYEMIEDSKIENSHVNHKYDWLFNLGLSYVDTPLAVKNPSNSQQLDEVLSDMFGVHIGVSWYFKKNLQIGVQTYWAKFETALGQNESGIGDIDIRLKYIFRQREKSSWAIMPQIIIPTNQVEINLQDKTGYSYGTDAVLSDEGIGYGGRLIYERMFKRFQFSANLGVMFNNKAEHFDNFGDKQYDYTTKLQTGIGSYIPIKKSWGINLEYMRVWSSPLFNSDLNPSEFYLGASFNINKRIVGFGGLGFGNLLAEDDGNDWRGVAGVKFSPWRRSKHYPEKPIKIVQGVQNSDVPVVTPMLRKTCTDNYVFGDSNAFTVLFKNDSYNSSSSQKELISKMAKLIRNKKNQISEIIVHGHTSSVALDDYNYKLGIRRANHIKSLLLQNGVSLNLFSQVDSKGEDILLESASDQEAHRINRRAEVLVKLMPEYYRECSVQ